jgi:exopolyphosphatase/guanosine-5'-triphosphate,3'-diphosphate pyrophosphatase
MTKGRSGGGLKKPEHWGAGLGGAGLGGAGHEGAGLGGGEAPRAGVGTRVSDDGPGDPARAGAGGAPNAQSDRGLPLERRDEHVYAALDLGTNNCRLLIARPEQRSRRKTDMLRIVDAFSRIVRLGEGMGNSHRICEPAIERTLDALDICREKMSARGVSRARLIATQACRAAENGAEFVERVRERTGLLLEVIDRETEARLAARGCGSLADPRAASILLFDIGGGSTELVWLTRDASGCELRHWTSLELGVVSLAEQFGGRSVSPAIYQAMTARALEGLASFAERTAAERRCERFHLLGTSGTVTTLAGVHLGLERYDRWRVDGLWLSDEDATRAIDSLRAMDFDQRAANGCIGPQRADLVLAGCAIFEAIRSVFPASRTRIADRGLREGMLLEMMEADGVFARES